MTWITNADRAATNTIQQNRNKDQNDVCRTFRAIEIKLCT